MRSAPIVLVPGFWLGAWAWDEVTAALRADGHEAGALTLPGLDSIDADRSGVTMSDHVDAICAAVSAAMVYVDSAPGVGAIDSGFEGADLPLDWEVIEKEENLDGLSEEQKET